MVYVVKYSIENTANDSRILPVNVKWDGAHWAGDRVDSTLFGSAAERGVKHPSELTTIYGSSNAPEETLRVAKTSPSYVPPRPI